MTGPEAAIRRLPQFQKSNRLQQEIGLRNEDAMEGQWIGSYTDGTIVLDIDDCGDHFEGRVRVFDGAGLPGTVALIRTSDRKPNQTLELKLTPLHPQTTEIITPDQLSQLMPDAVFPKTAKVTCELKDETLYVS
jgi:hypothetical protein